MRAKLFKGQFYYYTEQPLCHGCKQFKPESDCILGYNSDIKEEGALCKECVERHKRAGTISFVTKNEKWAIYWDN